MVNKVTTCKGCYRCQMRPNMFSAFSDGVDAYCMHKSLEAPRIIVDNSSYTLGTFDTPDWCPRNAEKDQESIYTNAIYGIVHCARNFDAAGVLRHAKELVPENEWPGVEQSLKEILS